MRFTRKIICPEISTGISPCFLESIWSSLMICILLLMFNLSGCIPQSGETGATGRTGATVGTAAVSPENLLKNVLAAYKKVTALQAKMSARFTRKDPEKGPPKGEQYYQVAFARPNRINFMVNGISLESGYNRAPGTDDSKMITSLQEKMLVACDGKNLYRSMRPDRYESAPAPSTISEIEHACAGWHGIILLDLLDGKAQFLNLDSEKSNLTVKASSRMKNDRCPTILEAIIKDREDTVEQRLYIDPGSLLACRYEVVMSSGDTNISYELDIDYLAIDEKQGPEAFRFTPPPGAKQELRDSL